ncbi:MAG: Fe-S cluster protein, partial [Aeromicrobium sp.]|nr:Fe-S cluster protein [Aeromicrobium sp.]
NFPAELNNIFKGLERKGNPWGMDPKNRMDWAKNLDFEVKQVGKDVEDLDEVEWLFWVGCAGAFEDRAKKTTQAVAELLDMAGVSFAVLGDGETCTGDPARRAGNEIVFAQLAMQNAEVFKETKVKKVVSTCAHCFNTLKNEYAEFGVELEVVHHTQLLNRLVREGKLKPLPPVAGEEKKKITYHDPCFLGRHNQVYEPPRELLNVIPGAEFTEMPRNQEKSFCCGAGGARMWMEESLGSRINVNRTEEAIATGADQIAVGCPFCRVMLSDGLTLKQSEGAAREEVEVLDVAQMLLTSVKRAPAPKPSKDDDKAVVAEAEAAAAAAAASTDAAATDKATEAEPDAADKADPDSISDTADVGAGAKAHEEGDPADKDTTDVDELDEPAGGSDSSDQALAAEHNVKVDESGGGHADESAAPDEPRNADARAEAAEVTETSETSEDAEKAESVEPEVNNDPASEKEEAAWANVGAVNTDATPSQPAATEPAATEPAEEEAEPAEEEAEPEANEAPKESAPEAKVDAEPDAEPAVNNDPASEKEEAAWANVGAVNTDTTPSQPAATEAAEEKAEPEAVAEEPEPEESPAEKVTHVPDETEPVEEDAREEEANAAAKDKAKAQAPDEITSVDDIESTADPVSEDTADLSDANPSGKDLSTAATQLAFDDVVEDEPAKDDTTS